MAAALEFMGYDVRFDHAEGFGHNGKHGEGTREHADGKSRASPHLNPMKSLGFTSLSRRHAVHMPGIAA